MSSQFTEILTKHKTCLNLQLILIQIRQITVSEITCTSTSETCLNLQLILIQIRQITVSEITCTSTSVLSL